MIERFTTVDGLLGNPLLLLGVTVLIVLAYHYIRGMPYAEFVFWTQVKHRVALLLETTNLANVAESVGLSIPGLRKLSAFIASIRLVTTKQYRNDDEYLLTIEKGPKDLARGFKRIGIAQHMIAGSKRRETPEGKQWAHSQWVYQHADGTQTEIWLYRNGDGTVDIYAHHEESIFNPPGHLNTPFTPGDPAGALDPVLDE